MAARRISPFSFLARIALCLFLNTLLPAQTAHKTTPKPLPPSAFKLVAIKITGAKRYTPDEVIAAAGIEIGQTVSDDDFKRASERLGESGVFGDVTYSFEYAPDGTRLEMQVTENEKLIPARFDNFVWFSDSELQNELHTRVPLFHDELPITGSLVDQVSETLQAMLVEHNIPGRADYLRFGHNDGPIEAFVFTVTGPNILIHNVDFTGAAATELPLLQAAAKQLQGQEYLRSTLRVQADMNFLPVFLAHGYLKAQINIPQARIVPDPEKVLVDITFPVHPGPQYKLTGVQWSGNTLFPAEKLEPLVHLQAGQPANPIQLEGDLHAVKQLYGTLGYMTESAQLLPEMDDAQATVRYQIHVHEGDAFKMGDLEIKGLDSHTTGRLLAEWKLRGGDPYNSSYLRSFLDQAPKFLPPGDWKPSILETLNEADKTVDVTLRFSEN